MAYQKMHQFVLVDSAPAEAKQTERNLQPALREYQAELIVMNDGQEALDYLLAHLEVCLLITEYRLEGLGGLKLIQELKAARPTMPALLLSGTSDATIAIKAVQAGAYDFLPKPTEAEELSEVIGEALRGLQSTAPPETDALTTTAPDKPRLIGKSRAMSKVYRDLAKLAATPVTVLIRGETGTGKELVARALYEHGHRAHKPFIAVNCAAIPDNLLESELFGHEKGAFTGATSAKMGRFEQANGATLFLDEIGDMQPLLQAKMLRVLQERVIQRVGGSTEIPVDVRVIAATHRNLEQMVEEGTFRADLLYRLNGATLKLPPLRDRLGDAALLTDHFLNAFGVELGIHQPTLTAEAHSFLSRQFWPGNVRQLQNVLRQAILKRRELPINPSDLEELLPPDSDSPLAELSLLALSQNLLTQASNNELEDGAYRELVQQVEQTLLPLALTQTDGNLTQAAKILGLTRYTLREKLKGIRKS